jgi:hypothetical protein
MKDLVLEEGCGPVELFSRTTNLGKFGWKGLKNTTDLSAPLRISDRGKEERMLNLKGNVMESGLLGRRIRRWENDIKMYVGLMHLYGSGLGFVAGLS